MDLGLKLNALYGAHHKDTDRVHIFFVCSDTTPQIYKYTSTLFHLSYSFQSYTFLDKNSTEKFNNTLIRNNAQK